MIIVSLLLILVAVALIVLGLLGGSSTLLITSIVASLLAAVFLVIGARRAAGRRAASGGGSAEPTAEPAFADLTAPEAADLAAPEARAAGEHDAATELGADSGPGVTQSLGAQARRVAPAADQYDPDYDRASSFIGGARSDDAAADAWRAADAADPAVADGGADVGDEFAEPDADDPADEPLPQAVRPADAVQIARLTAEVLVVDGRPRYHLAECPHLVGKLTEGLPAAEAVELGFSPCGLCRPVDRLVAAATH